MKDRFTVLVLISVYHIARSIGSVTGAVAAFAWAQSERIVSAEGIDLTEEDKIYEDISKDWN